MWRTTENVIKFEAYNNLARTTETPMKFVAHNWNPEDISGVHREPRQNLKRSSKIQHKTSQRDLEDSFICLRKKRHAAALPHCKTNKMDTCCSCTCCCNQSGCRQPLQMPLRGQTHKWHRPVSRCVRKMCIPRETTCTIRLGFNIHVDTKQHTKSSGYTRSPQNLHGSNSKSKGLTRKHLIYSLFHVRFVFKRSAVSIFHFRVTLTWITS